MSQHLAEGLAQLPREKTEEASMEGESSEDREDKGHLSVPITYTQKAPVKPKYLLEYTKYKKREMQSR